MIKELRIFGLTMGFIFAFWGVFFLKRGSCISPYLLIVSVLFILSGILYPNLLKNIHKVWTLFTRGISHLMAILTLVLVFYLVITPLGIILRLSGSDLLKKSFPGSGNSYWRDRKETETSDRDYEKQF